MRKPDTVKFTGLTLSASDLKEASNAGVKEVVGSDWKRVHFSVPTARDAIQHVFDWLKANCQGQYTAYKYHDSSSYTEYKMVVRFEDKNDAIIFKLQDGHKAWEHKN
ncbi:hypothetical protein D3C87_583480 [compost metagenome]